mmetsp:Transcript_61711/g.179001  ORF Transcript_61711/g.179001 Transcript_61711/m.179001 type:complete len:115 (+) Transcript_61711:129-473(+)
MCGCEYCVKAYFGHVQLSMSCSMSTLYHALEAEPAAESAAAERDLRDVAVLLRAADDACDPAATLDPDRGNNGSCAEDDAERRLARLVRESPLRVVAELTSVPASSVHSPRCKK